VLLVAIIVYLFLLLFVLKGYGLTETCGGAARMIEIDESQRHGSVGRLVVNMEAKIVDPVTGEALPPGHKGELWLRGPIIMKGDDQLCYLLGPLLLSQSTRAMF
jgi:long-subunit acyl-CoA synthetase (AMP-forming)